ncbi:TolA protein, partial [hydrothermal vent metagenome]
TQTTENTDSSVNDALQEALAANTSPPSGPPMTRGQKDAMRLAIQQCWNVGALSSEALRTTVVVAVSMTTDAKPVTSSIKQLSATGGSGTAVKQAYEAARRAIIRCGATGYNLPRDKYDRWRNIEITFNPEKMRIK